MFSRNTVQRTWDKLPACQPVAEFRHCLHKILTSWKLIPRSLNGIVFSRVMRWSLAVGLFCSLMEPGLMAESTGNDNVGNVDAMTNLRVVLKGENGEPVAGAAVMPYAMRTIEDPGTHGFWDERRYGAPRDYFSNEQGVATIRYPAKIWNHAAPLTTSQVTFVARHSNFVREVVHFDLGAKEAVVELKKGCELHLSAMDANGNAVRDFGVLIAGPFSPEFWQDDGASGRSTSSLNDGTWQTLLVKPQENGCTLFSSLLPLRVRPDQSMRMRGIKLTPGSRIVGCLSDNVPRPIKNGTVIITSVPKPEGDSFRAELPSLCWYDWTSIQENGSFVFPSVPGSGEIQMIAICDGWLSKTTVPDADSFVMGQLFQVEGDRVNVSIEMEGTGSFELTILNPDGSRLKGGTVSSWPNQRRYKGGVSLLGMCRDSMREIRNQLRPAQEREPFIRNRDLPFLERPVIDGKVVLKGIPTNMGVALELNHPDFRFATPGKTGQSWPRHQLNSAQPKQIVLKTAPH